MRRLIGQGAQGVVYLAHDPHFDIDRAIKVLPADFRDEDFMARFKVDAIATSRLNTPNVVRVFDFDPDYPYLVMEYCRDGDLNRYIKSRRRRSLKEILSITRQICEALVAAHEHEPPILHRDIKPGNVLFQKGVAKVADFGLAKMHREGGSLTTTRGMMGTVRYCSPEQLRDASRVDHRTDLWSVGIILYELLTWSRPFDRSGDSGVNVMVRILTEPPRPPSFDLPGPVSALLQQSLQKERDQRYASARAMRDALDEALRSIPEAAEILVPPETVVDEISRLVTQVAELVDKGRAEDASTILREIRRAAPDDSVATFWQRQVREALGKGSSPTGSSAAADAVVAQEIAAELAGVDSLIRARSYREARQKLGTILARDPENTLVPRLLEQISEEERRLRQDLDQAHREADGKRQAGDLAGVREVWERLDRTYPGVPEIQAEVTVAGRELELQGRRRDRQVAEQEASSWLARGDHVQALTTWETYAERHPEDADAKSRLQEIRAVIAARERAERLAVQKQDAQRRASACLEAGDRWGAVGAWRLLARELPDDPDARAQIERLEIEIRTIEQRALLEEVDDLASALAARLESRRFGSLPDQEAVLAGVVKKATAARTAGGEDLQALCASLRQAGERADAILESAIATRCQALLEQATKARDWLPEEAPRREAAAGSIQTLEGAMRQALAVISDTMARPVAGDPLEPLDAAGRQLALAVETLAGERQRALADARARVAAALREAGAAIASLVAIVSVLPDPRVDARSYEARLADLQAGADSRVPEKLELVAGRALLLKSEVEGVRLGTVRTLVEACGALVQEARAFTLFNPRDRLDDLVRRATQALDGKPGEPVGAVASSLARLHRDLQEELRVALQDREARLVGARDRWSRAVQEWRRLLAADPGPDRRREGEELGAMGEAALSAMRLEDLDGCAARLDGLVRRCRLEEVWIQQRDALLAIEGHPGADGQPGEPPGPQARKLLARYRKALVTDAGDSLRALGPELEALARAERSERREADAPAGEVAAVTKGQRRLSARHAPTALRAYDDLLVRHHQCVERGRQGEAARIAADLGVLRRRLLQPPPVWRRLLPVMGALAAVTVGAAAVLAGNPGAGDSISVLSASGEVAVEEVLRDGAPVGGLGLRVGEEGVIWRDLRPGHYAVRVAGGPTRQFDIPGTRVVVVSAEARNYPQIIARELGVGELVRQP